MKKTLKTLIITTALVAGVSGAAEAHNSFYLGIGAAPGPVYAPAPVYAAPAPVVEPYPYYDYGYYGVGPHRWHRPGYDWGYWHGHRR